MSDDYLDAMDKLIAEMEKNPDSDESTAKFLLLHKPGQLIKEALRKGNLTVDMRGHLT